MKYRKNALVEAEQFLPAEGKIPAGVIADGLSDPRKSPSQWVLDTLEGRHSLRPGDYICTGPAGERWNVEQSIFEATYEPDTTPARAEAQDEGAAGEPVAYGADHQPWCQPGDQTDRAFRLRFEDPDMREMIWTGPDAEKEALAAYNQYAPSWNVYLFSGHPRAHPSPTPAADESALALLIAEGDVRYVNENDVPTSAEDNKAWASFIAKHVLRHANPAADADGVRKATETLTAIVARATNAGGNWYGDVAAPALAALKSTAAKEGGEA